MFSALLSTRTAGIAAVARTPAAFTALRAYATGERHEGVVKWFNRTKGYGFITPEEAGAPDLFVHHSNIQMEGYRYLEDGAQVEYVSDMDENGRARATGVVSKYPPRQDSF
ncbi:hypothetical protein SARC_03443 [Sphaeroforma arctica JP610]|uniref:CSD domain-containing protein n=1 Tax=Sphaeroforma arctica JP610 TaxID=667725 RepID=A0A0L0G7X0_9EUKA|nr:hypothetical protein SARC_03443 [Sphaeroforma arctica JP610]KNC84338.1 hypothetical protein SARC_03443 [Sphaeroforma arctica JP610]|eukprot:XP_014158240.1 hypothetical protein SARC_03443 [Sphaeroforma arctica JP610]